MEDELSRVSRLLCPMSLELGPLMDLVRAANGRGSCSVPAGMYLIQGDKDQVDLEPALVVVEAHSN